MTTRINLSFPEENRNFSKIVKGQTGIQFSNMFKDAHKEEGPFVLEIEGAVQKYKNGIYFDNFTVYWDHLTIAFRKNTHSFNITGKTLKFTIRRIKSTDFYPESLNRLVKNERESFSGVIFYGDKDDLTSLPIYQQTITCSFNDMVENIRNILNHKNINTANMKIGRYCGDSQNIEYHGEDDLSFRQFRPKEITSIWVRSIDYVRYKVNGNLKKVMIAPKVPRVLSKFSLKFLDRTRDRRLLQNARHISAVGFRSGVPIHMLPKILSGVRIERIERVGIPFNRYTECWDNLKTNEGIRFVLENLIHKLNDDSSEADLRALFWDHLIQRLLFDGNIPRNDLSFDLFSEYHLATFLNAQGRIDLAAVAKVFSPVPFLLIEIGKEKPGAEFDHKDHSKLLSMCTESCKKLYSAARAKNGVDPMKVKVFGMWIGNSQVRCCVAHPVKPRTPIEDDNGVSIHASSPKEWTFDLLDDSARDCECSSCFSEQSGMEAFKLPGEDDHILSAIARESISTTAEAVPNSLPELLRTFTVSRDSQTLRRSRRRQDNEIPDPTREINWKALAKVCVFLNCAKRSCIELEEGISPSESASQSSSTQRSTDSDLYQPQSLSSSKSVTPSKKQLSNEAAKTLEPQGAKHNRKQVKCSALIPREVFEITKQKSRESEIYINAGMVLPFLPRLVSLQPCPGDPDSDVFVFEKMHPLVKAKEELCKYLRKGHYVIDCTTFAIHVLFELFLLHTQLQYVHSDISPNNIMFSEETMIWKLSDFDQSLPIDESLVTNRTGGTSGYLAPEAEKTGFFEPASDVYSLGCVLKKILFHSLLAHKNTRATRKFDSICNLMLKEDPGRRITVRDALKAFYRLFLKLRIPEKLEIYGANLIFPLVQQELQFDVDDDSDYEEEYDDDLDDNDDDDFYDYDDFDDDDRERYGSFYPNYPDSISNSEDRLSDSKTGIDSENVIDSDSDTEFFSSSSSSESDKENEIVHNVSKYKKSKYK